jgi:hypothetical protein
MTKRSAGTRSNAVAESTGRRGGLVRVLLGFVAFFLGVALVAVGIAFIAVVALVAVGVALVAFILVGFGVALFLIVTLVLLPGHG